MFNRFYPLGERGEYMEVGGSCNPIPSSSWSAVTDTRGPASRSTWFICVNSLRAEDRSSQRNSISDWIPDIAHISQCRRVSRFWNDERNAYILLFVFCMWFYVENYLIIFYIKPRFSSTISWTAGFILTFLSWSGVSQTNPTNRSSFWTYGFLVPRYSTR